MNLVRSYDESACENEMRHTFKGNFLWSIHLLSALMTKISD